MTRSVATIAQQSLRRLGVRVVPVDDSPTLTERVPVADIATAALVELGVLNSDGTPAVEVVPAATIATQALVELGVLNSDLTPAGGIVAPAVIATGALVELGVIAADETPAAADQALALDRVSSVHGALFGAGVAQWTVDTIPRSVAEEYTKLTSAYVASSFGKAADPQVVAMLEGRVRLVSQVMNADSTYMLGEVSSVHGSLVAHGVASWSLSAIPRAFAEEYTKLTAAFAAAAFGKQVDPQLVAMLEARIRTGAIVMTADVPFMLDKIASVHAALDAQGSVFWTGEAIPRAFVEDYVKLTVAYASASFGKPADPQLVALAEGRIRKGVMVLSADDNAQQAVQAIHDDLVSRGIARWTSMDIPEPVGDAMVLMAAQRLAPLFGGQANPNEARAAEVAILRFIALPTSGETMRGSYF